MNHNLDTSALLPSAVAGEPKEMLSVTEADGVQKVRINFSSLAILQKCAREAQYSLVRGLKPQLESPALLFGTAIHKGLETYYCGERTERKIPHDYANIMQMIGCGQWQESWGESLLFRAARAFVEKAQPLAALPSDDKRSIDSGTWVLQNYFKDHILDEYVTLHDSAGPVVERRVNMNVYSSPELKIELFGTIDFVMRSEVTGHILVGDHKTMSSARDFYDTVRPNFQYVAYSWAARTMFGYDTNMFMVNALEVKPRPKKNAAPPSSHRQIVDITEEDYRELQLAIIDAVTNHLRHRKNNHFPMAATGACITKYGACKFRDICSSPTQLRESIVRAKFVGAQYAQT